MISCQGLSEGWIMDAQTITTARGERLVVLSEADYNALVEAAEDAIDLAAVARFRAQLAAGDEELIPSDVVDRLLNGENRIRVWREQRGLSAKALADQAGIAQPFLSQIETGKRDGTVETLKKIAAALSLTLDDLVG
jgi:DNA-binding XRE family transcriptional regulator